MTTDTTPSSAAREYYMWLSGNPRAGYELPATASYLRQELVDKGYITLDGNKLPKIVKEKDWVGVSGDEDAL